jgi:probable HAF family extracellular repeat protein
MIQAAVSSQGQITSLVSGGVLAGDTLSGSGGPSCLSVNGSVIAGFSATATRQRAVRYDRQADGSYSITNLGLLPGNVGAIATACSADGQIIVGYGTSPFRAFKVVGGQIIDLGTPSLGVPNRPTATAISADASIIAGTTYSGSIPRRGWALRSGTFTLINLLTGGTYNDVRSMNASGSTLVGEADWGGVVTAFTASPNGASVALARPTGFTSCSARAVNEDGTAVVGIASTLNTDRAVVWRNGVPEVLPPLSNADAAWRANAIAASGDIIGGESGGTAPGSSRACIWFGGSGAMAVDDLLAMRGIDLSSWRLSTVAAISADGGTLVGAGDHTLPGGAHRQELWVATITSYCPTDWNGDGGIDGEDVASFFVSWESGQADLNLDGGIDADDITEFFMRWSDGRCR